MNRSELIHQIRTKNSYLCVGLDPDASRIPVALRETKDPVLAFNQAIIDATKDLCVAYKLNTAFYESQGVSGWQTLERTAQYIGKEHLIIADAKRADIGNTSAQYAKAFFGRLPFDAITVAPYMGEDSVRPFLEVPGKWTILLGLTSNPGAADFELEPAGAELLYEKVLRKARAWGTPEQLMFVVGATRAAQIERIRELVPDHFLLVPGVGVQGGSLQAISEKGLTGDVGLLVNVSRGIQYAAEGSDFASAAREAAKGYRNEMMGYLRGKTASRIS